MNQPDMFDLVDDERRREAAARWQAPAPPDLSAYDEVFVDLETTGLRWWETDRPVGIAVRAGQQSWYLPFGHFGGGNLDEPTVKRWALQELRNKRIVNLNTKFDVHHMRAWGVDLDAQGNTFGDVAHYAALLDDNRKKFNLEDLSTDFLQIEQGKEKLALRDKGKIADLPAGEVAGYATRDVDLVDFLQTAMRPMLVSEGLEGVASLEDTVIPAVCEMERNGAPLDIELLKTWDGETTVALEDALHSIRRATGIQLATPDGIDGNKRLFDALGVSYPRVEERERTSDGSYRSVVKASFADDLLEGIDHPVVQTLRRAKQIASLRSKFITKFLNGIDSHGILRYSLNQLRYETRRGSQGGAVSGRFSASEICEGVGANIQQVFSVDNQEDFDPTTGIKNGLTKDWIIRRLFLPGAGTRWLSADAKQIEYRLFAHYANSEAILRRYREDPETDYHDVVQIMLREKVPTIMRKRTKAVNFSKVFGAGEVKFAELTKLPIGEARALNAVYEETFPEVKPLLKMASRAAETRGFVMTFDGRRARFGPTVNKRYYSALNRVIQGTAASYNKKVMVEIHKNRAFLEVTPRLTVHDEWDGDQHNPIKMAVFQDLLNTQYYPTLRVPILWDCGTGPNWAEAK